MATEELDEIASILKRRLKTDDEDEQAIKQEDSKEQKIDKLLKKLEIVEHKVQIMDPDTEKHQEDLTEEEKTDNLDVEIKNAIFKNSFMKINGDDSNEYILEKDDLLVLLNTRQSKRKENPMENQEFSKTIQHIYEQEDWSHLSSEEIHAFKKYLFISMENMQFFNHGLYRNQTKSYEMVQQVKNKHFLVICWGHDKNRSFCQKLTNRGCWYVKIFKEFDKEGQVVGEQIGDDDYILKSNSGWYDNIQYFNWNDDLEEIDKELSHDYFFVFKLKSVVESSYFGLDAYTIIFALQSRSWAEQLSTGFCITFMLWIFCIVTITCQVWLILEFLADKTNYLNYQYYAVFNYQMPLFRLMLVILVCIMQLKEIRQAAWKIEMLLESIIFEHAFSFMKRKRDKSIALTKQEADDQEFGDDTNLVRGCPIFSQLFRLFLSFFNLFVMLIQVFCCIAIMMMSFTIVYGIPDDEGALELIKDFTAILIINSMDDMVIVPLLEICCKLFGADYEKMLADILENVKIEDYNFTYSALETTTGRYLGRYFKRLLRTAFLAGYLIVVALALINIRLKYFGKAHEYEIEKGCEMYQMTMAGFGTDWWDTDWKTYMIKDCQEFGKGQLIWDEYILENFGYFVGDTWLANLPNCLQGKQNEDSGHYCVPDFDGEDGEDGENGKQRKYGLRYNYGKLSNPEWFFTLDW